MLMNYGMIQKMKTTLTVPCKSGSQHEIQHELIKSVNFAKSLSQLLGWEQIKEKKR